MPTYRFQANLRARLYRIIFGTDTPAGQAFDIVLIYVILASVFLVMLDSIEGFSGHYSKIFFRLEWFFTLLFTLEYLVRIYCSTKPLRYMRSFYGIVDLLSVLPSYLAFFITNANFLLIIRLFRVLRVFRVLKLMRYLSETNVLMRAMKMARRKVFVFFFSVIILTSIFGSLMFLLEGTEHGFTSIPKSIYWAIVTITTVGYGDITPQTPLCQTIAALAMLTGYAIIAVPTGIITAELSLEMRRTRQRIQCQQCQFPGHDSDALYCKNCGAPLPASPPETSAQSSIVVPNPDIKAK
jgi:voltage-gated potassium channel